MDPCRPGEALAGFEYCRMIFVATLTKRESFPVLVL